MAVRAVAPGEKAPLTRAKTVTQAVEGGTRRDQLVAMRARIARAIDEPNIRGADLAALSRRLLEIAKDIEGIDAADEEDSGGAATPDEAWDESAL